MTLLRAAARTMLASYFLINGAKALKDPAPFAADQQRFATTVVPLAKKVAPPEISAQIPQDAASLARFSGGLQVAGGLGMVFGKARRLGAGCIAASLVPQLMSANPTKGATPAERERNRDDLLKSLALLGGALIAAGDTEGRPSLSWRAQDQARRLQSNVDSTRKQFEKNVNSTRKQLEKNSGQTRKQLQREMTNAKLRARKQAKELQTRAKTR